MAPREAQYHGFIIFHSYFSWILNSIYTLESPRADWSLAKGSAPDALPPSPTAYFPSASPAAAMSRQVSVVDRPVHPPPGHCKAPWSTVERSYLIAAAVGGCLWCSSRTTVGCEYRSVLP